MVVVIVLLLGLNSIVGINKMGVELQKIYDRHLLGISHIKEANINLAYVGRHLRQMIIAPNNARVHGATP